MTEKLIAVTMASSRGSSLRITLPKEIAEMLNVGEKEHVGFYESNGEVIVKRIKYNTFAFTQKTFSTCSSF